MAQQAKVVKVGPGGRNNGPRPKVENPGKVFKRILGYVMNQYKAQVIIVLCCILLAVFAQVQGTLFMQTLIDGYILPLLKDGSNDFSGLFHAILRVAGFYAVGIIAVFVQNRLMATVTQGSLKSLRDELFTHMQTLPIKYFDTHAHGDIMSTYTNDTDAIRMMVSQSMPMLVQSILTILVMIIMMTRFSIPMFVVVCLFVAGMLTVTKKFGGMSSKYMMYQQRSLAAEEGFVEEMMAGQKVVQVFCHEEEAKQDFLKYNEKLFEDSKTANQYGNALMPILGNMGNLMYVVLAIVGGLMVYFQAPNLTWRGFSPVSVGIIITFLGMSRQLAQTVGQSSNQVALIAMGLAGTGRIFELIDEEPEEDEGFVTLVNAKHDENGELVEADHPTHIWAWKYPRPDGTVTYTELKGDIRLEHVDFGYVSEKLVLHDVSLFAKPGQKIAFVGSTGAGKTTITNLINRFYDIQKGKIRYDEINIGKIKKDDLRRSLGIVLQDTHLFTGTVRENIAFGKLDATEDEVVAAAKLANAHGFIMRLPQGYDTMLTGDGANLSQGQRQLLAIARAAIADPPVLILDEATSSIDTRTEKIVQDGMDKLMAGRTTFVIAHRLSTIRNSDCIMVLEQGRIIERGSHDDLIEEKGRYYQLYTGNKA